MSATDMGEIIRAIFAAYLANDRQRVEDALTDDFHFTTPYDDNIDKPTYFARCWRNSGWIASHELERIFVEGDAAFVTYRCTGKDGTSFRNTEFFAFDGDKVKRIDVYFGATYQNGKFVKRDP
ncbi:nuclear transport factor 2 family protein [Bradyrhizobium sp. BRP22]|uniref:nuclear transport factor 2 family protein n=1 Tax=Bradyrhizobium sp. BRP22 TaxID=2793821 RepID=UPI001CD5138D|nr:nuclear transport factor 2 family protein [Bradyrhizobium sp. BRP22]MCA1452036.1 nuclear transport factor 2 family protein [Bradyrhizobium sp. BRP22]